MNKFVLILIVVFVVGCSKDPSIPSGYPNKNEMALLLADIYQLEGLINNPQTMEGRNNASSYYKFVLDKHHITQAKFDEVVKWYTSNPEFYLSVYDKVISILSEREAVFLSEMAKRKESSDQQTLLEESKSDLWRGLRAYQFPLLDTSLLNAQIPFLVNDTLLGAGFYKLEARFAFDSVSYKSPGVLFMLATYVDNTKDSVQVDVRNGVVSLMYKTLVDKKLSALKGNLFKHDVLSKDSLFISDVKFSFLPEIVN